MPKKKRKPKNYVREVYPTKRDWLEKGRGIGGTSASAIVGLNPWKSKLELYNSIVNKRKSHEKTNDAMTFGTKMEPLIRKQFRLTHPEYKVRSPQGYEQYRRNDLPWMTATVDGLLTDKVTGKRGIWECKTHEIRNREDAEKWSHRIPPQYLIQVLHYLLVLNDCEFVELTAWLNFYDYDGETRRLSKTEVRYEHIERSDVLKEIDWLEHEERKFMEENVERRIPPQITINF